MLFLQTSGYPRELPSFPTRRSSDLASSGLERRFLEPFKHRLYGAIPELDYAHDAVRDALPANIKVSEFFFQAASFLKDRKSTRLNSSHVRISYAVFCLKKKTPQQSK